MWQPAKEVLRHLREQFNLAYTFANRAESGFVAAFRGAPVRISLSFDAATRLPYAEVKLTQWQP